VFQQPHHPIVVDVVEEGLNVSVQYPVHPSAIDPHCQGVQRVVLAASWAEPIREVEKVFLVNGVQYLRHRTLDDLVFQRRDTERP
jgi:hypothetical protein